MIDVADDRRVAVDDRAVLDRFDRGRRQVDDDIALAEREMSTSARRRALAASSCARTLAGTLSAFSVAPATIPV